jgi:hypothetical protein
MKLTPDQIREFPAGRDLDFLIAQHVMNARPRIVSTEYEGQRVVGRSYSIMVNHQSEEMPGYSTDMRATWDVVSKLTDPETPNDCELRTAIGGWRCDLGRGFAFAETAQLAICRAALIAVTLGVILDFQVIERQAFLRDKNEPIAPHNTES